MRRLRCLPEPTVDEKPLRIMLSEYNSMYGDTLIMHGVVHMEDDIHRKQNDLILKLLHYTYGRFARNLL